MPAMVCRTQDTVDPQTVAGRGPLHCAAECRRFVTAAGAVPLSARAAATPCALPSGASIRTCRRSGSSSAPLRVACTSARAASRPARSPRPSSAAAGGCRLSADGPATVAHVSDPSLVRFRVAVQGALAHLESRREEINDLNVFPVADGDTGDNMALTLRAVLAELDRLAGVEDRTVDEIGRDEIVETVARAALLGARGNSRVMLSHLIRGTCAVPPPPLTRGAAEELVSRPGERVDPRLPGAPQRSAAQRAYGSVRE